MLHLLDTATGKERPAPKLARPRRSSARSTGTRTARTSASAFSAARSPADVYSLDVASGKVERWTESETGGLNTAGFASPSWSAGRASTAATISGFLYRPPARFTGKRPVIINIHGGPEGQSRPDFLGRNNYYLERAGRRHRLSQRARLDRLRQDVPRSSTTAEQREDSVKDIGALLDWIATRPDLDATA